MPDVTPPPPQAQLLSQTARLGLILGIAVLLATLILPAPEGLTMAGWRTLGLAGLMAIWWSTEPVPLGVTALLPIILMPLIGVASIEQAAAPFAHPLVYLFFGGFLLSTALSRWGLHRRLAFQVISRVGSSPRRIVLGFMIATAFLSMWINNTSTTMLMLPVAMSVITALELAGGDAKPVRPFALAVLLGTAYAASIGGVGTLIGTAPNALFAAYLSKQHGIEIPFASWSAIGMPLVALFVPLGWLLLTRVVFAVPVSLPGDQAGSALIDRLAITEPLLPAERRLAYLLGATALAWLTRPFLEAVPGLSGLTDSGIAVTSAALLFLIPSGDKTEPRFLLNWSEAQTIPWQVLLLFGGGLSLAAAMDKSGLAAWIGSGLTSLGTLPPLVFILLLVGTVLLMTEMASNTATVAALLPVIAAIAGNTGMDLVMVAAALTISASCAFMLPVATPPNALVFSTGYVTVPTMIRAGIYMNLASLVLVTLVVTTLIPLIFDPHILPKP